MPIPFELGEPDQSFYNLWKEEGDELWEDEVDLWGEDVEEELSLRHPGFNKWTIQQAASGGDNISARGENFYCVEAQVHFTGELLDGTQFVSSQENGIPQRFILGEEDVMHGFNLAVSSMQPGEKAIFTIPPALTMTKLGSPASIPSNVPPDQTLRFEIELIALFTITDIFKDQGILKKIVKNKEPNREQSHSSDFVFVRYHACLEDGTSVSKSEGGVEFSLTDGFFCPGFVHSVKTMEEGEEAVFIVKPQYAFGDQGRPSQGDEAAVPPNATVYVHLQFVCWIYRTGLDQAIAKRILSVRNSSERICTQSQAVVKVRLLGKLQDGTVFDRRGHGDDDEPFEFVVDEGKVIDGLDEAVMTMEEGEVAEVTIPSHHAFGDVGSDHQHQLASVPPNSTVIYEIELLSVFNEKHPLLVESRDEVVRYAHKKEEEGDNYFNLGNYLRAHRRYYKARLIIEYSRFGKKWKSGLNIIELLGIPIDTTSDMDAQMEQMLISFTLKEAKCAIQLRCYKQAAVYYREVLNQDAANVEAQEQITLLEELSEHSSIVDTDAMHRGFKEVPPEYEPLLEDLMGGTIRAYAYSPRRKNENSYTGSVLFLPHVQLSAQQANASQVPSTPSTSTTTSGISSPACATQPTSATASGNAAQRSPILRTDRGFIFRCFGPSPTN
ncbi:peptidyl-prolyl cis-trans isomerase FKBP62-like [Oryza brachyantha]|uniref:peptidylprolyl isomerase n=1 Tax=Oryza brachyantha TaxID=4533 RepID=J3L140_ORYBR|nr:peptidyl-prolyl cis-trans isomerase FKBP62-like [Oryza brachyantha]XP_015698818.1 peptidyl-prolyl cis-trans isomerase FKBP62-like [Oryza brachyantha]